MCDAVRGVLAEYENSWSVLPAFQGYRDEFLNKVTQLEGLSLQHDLIARNRGLMKHQSRAALVEKATEVQRVLKLQALSINDLLLEHTVNFPVSRLLTSNVVYALEMVDLLIEKAQLHIGSLGNFGFTQADIDELQALRTAFHALRTEPRSKVIDRKYVTDQIRTLVSEIRQILRAFLDEMVKMLKDEQPEFFGKYMSARKVINHPANHKDKDESSGDKPIPGAA